MHPPHGAAIIRQVLRIGVQAQLERHGFTRRSFTFTRFTATLREQITLSVRTDQGAKGRLRGWKPRAPGRLFWLIAEARVQGFEDPPRLEVHTQHWRYDEGLAGDPTTFLDVDDFAVTLAETIEQRVVPGFKELRDLRTVARRLERRSSLRDAAAIWRAVGQHRRAARLEAEDEIDSFAAWS